MSNSDPNKPNNPYEKNPYDEPAGPRPGAPYGQPSEQPLAPPPGPYDPYGGFPGGPPGTMPGKVSAARMIFFIAGGLQALFSLLALIVFTAARNDLEETYGDLGVSTGVYYTMFIIFLLHAIAGIVLAARFPQGGNGLRIGAIVWSALLVLVGLAALPLGVLWLLLGIVCIVLLASAESAAWFNRRNA